MRKSKGVALPRCRLNLVRVEQFKQFMGKSLLSAMTMIRIKYRIFLDRMHSIVFVCVFPVFYIDLLVLLSHTPGS